MHRETVSQGIKRQSLGQSTRYTPQDTANLVLARLNLAAGITGPTGGRSRGIRGTGDAAGERGPVCT